MGSPTWRQLAIAIVVGVAAALLSIVQGLPERGGWIALSWLAGFGIRFRVAGWQAWLAGLAGIAIGIVAGVLVNGSWTLDAFVVVALGAMYSHGWAAAWLVRRLRRLGSAAARDVPTLVIGAAMLAAVVVGVWLVWELAHNPL